MIVLDTNVLSEALRPKPSAKVLDWMRSQPITALFSTTITEAEFYYGLALLPKGARRSPLESIVEPIFTQDLAGRVLPFDSSAAPEYASIAASRRHAGRPISQSDARIAAIVRSCRASLATCNVDDFSDCGLNIIDPWL
jgi:toxin FitB